MSRENANTKDNMNKAEKSGLNLLSSLANKEQRINKRERIHRLKFSLELFL